MASFLMNMCGSITVCSLLKNMDCCTGINGGMDLRGGVDASGRKGKVYIYIYSGDHSANMVYIVSSD